MCGVGITVGPRGRKAEGNNPGETHLVELSPQNRL